MEIIIQGYQAVMKQGTSFDFISENRLFTDSDSYTLSIVFPLAECPQNLKIFGHLERKDVEKEQVLYDCEIRHRDMVKVGVITITEINEAEVKTQFLEGRSAQNFDQSFDNTYINELYLGNPGIHYARNNSPSQMWYVRSDELDYVAMPWVNSYSGNIQNEARYDSNHGNYTWVYKTGNTQDSMKLSFQPFLIYIVRNMCSALGYSLDVTAWQNSVNRYLLICNTLPAAWDMPAFARAMPHWTVTEFFSQLELLLNGTFDIDHRKKKITFSYVKDITDNLAKVYVKNVIDKFKVEVKKEETDNFRLAKLKEYEDCDHRVWKLYSCSWLINALQEDIVEYTTMQEFFDWTHDLRNIILSTTGDAEQAENMEMLHRIYYVRREDTYFAFRNTGMVTKNGVVVDQDGNIEEGGKYVYSRSYAPVPINIFGNRNYKGKDDKTVKLKMVPAWIDETDNEHGYMMFLSMSNYEEKSDNTDLGRHELSMVHPGPLSMLSQGEENGGKEYFDKIYIAYWNGSVPLHEVPMPCVDKLTVDANWVVEHFPFSLRFDSEDTVPLPSFEIDRKKKYTFSFLTDTIPDVMAVFCIEGKEYLCEKLTATFNEQGMSRLVKGVFWKLKTT